MRKRIWAGAAGIALTGAVVAGGMAVANSGEDGPSVTGPQADKATAAALKATGRGHGQLSRA